MKGVACGERLDLVGEVGVGAGVNAGEGEGLVGGGGRVGSLILGPMPHLSSTGSTLQVIAPISIVVERYAFGPLKFMCR